MGKAIIGLFDSIFADLYCPTKERIGKNTEIQIKWQDQKVRGMHSYHIGDIVEEIDNEYNDTWIRTDFICNVCSKFTEGWKGMEYIKTEDQSRHVIFVRIENSKIREILSEKEFSEIGVENFIS